jgi:tetratricopeptide (TPR) repeat protein
LDRAIALEEEYAWALALRGETYREMGEYEQALADLDRAIALDEKYAWALALRGETYRRIGEYEQALADLDRAIALDENDAWALASRGETYRAMGQYEQALADFDRAIELRPEYHWCFYSRALAFGALGKTDRVDEDLMRAIQHAREVYEKKPQDWRNTFNLAVYYLLAGESERADSLYQEAVSGGASLYIIQEAIRDLEDVLSVFPDHSQAQAMRDLLRQHLRKSKA